MTKIQDPELSAPEYEAIYKGLDKAFESEKQQIVSDDYPPLRIKIRDIDYNISVVFSETKDHWTVETSNDTLCTLEVDPEEIPYDDIADCIQKHCKENQKVSDNQSTQVDREKDKKVYESLKFNSPEEANKFLTDNPEYDVLDIENDDIYVNLKGDKGKDI